MSENEKTLLDKMKEYIDLGMSVTISKDNLVIPKEVKGQYAVSVFHNDEMLTVFFPDFERLSHVFDRKDVAILKKS